MSAPGAQPESGSTLHLGKVAADVIVHGAASNQVHEKKRVQDKSPKSITAAYTLTSADSGSVFNLPAVTGPFSITLPAVSEGLEYTIRVTGAISTGAVTITAGSAIITGNFVSSDGTGVTGGNLGGTNKTNIILGTTTKIGDRVNLYCDGTKWHCLGFTALNTAVTVS